MGLCGNVLLGSLENTQHVVASIKCPSNQFSSRAGGQNHCGLDKNNRMGGRNHCGVLDKRGQCLNQGVNSCIGHRLVIDFWYSDFYRCAVFVDV